MRLFRNRWEKPVCNDGRTGFLDRSGCEVRLGDTVRLVPCGETGRVIWNPVMQCFGITGNFCNETAPERTGRFTPLRGSIIIKTDGEDERSC